MIPKFESIDAKKAACREIEKLRPNFSGTQIAELLGYEYLGYKSLLRYGIDNKIITKVQEQKPRTKWSDEELRVLLNSEGLSAHDVRLEGRTISAIKAKARDIGVKLISPKKLFGSDLSNKELLDLVATAGTMERFTKLFGSTNIIIKRFGSWTNAKAECGPTGPGCFNPKINTIVYLLEFTDIDGQVFFKVGITQRSIKLRFSGGPKYNILKYKVTDINDAFGIEKAIIQSTNRYIPKEPWFERNGKTECFIETDLTEILNKFD